MKKMIVAAAVAAMAAGTAFADRDAATLRAEAKIAYKNGTSKEFCANMTTNEWRAIAEDVIADATTNNYAGTPGRFHWSPDLSRSPIVAEFDQRLADAGIGIPPPWEYDVHPKMSEKWIASPTNAAEVAKRRATIALTRKYGKCLYYKFTAPESANFVKEMHIFSSQKEVDKITSRVLGIVQGSIKRKMREKGMQIVSKDGVNPVQVEMDKLSAAFNAPRYAGLKEWFATWYPEYEWIDSDQMSDAEVSKYKDDVFYGDRAFGTREQVTLRFYLGVTGYNAFVKQYNGEE